MGERFNVNNASEKGKIGGRKSAEARRRKKELREVFQTLLSMPYDKGVLADIDKAENFKALGKKNLTVGERIAVTQVVKALKGDQQAVMFIRDTSGQKPTERQEIGVIPVPVFTGEDDLPD